MKKIVFFIAVLAIISCKEEPKVDYAILSGKIVNSNAKELSVSSSGSLLKTIKVANDGTFIDTLTVATGYYSLTEHNKH